MRQYMSLAEVEAVFAALDLPLIDKSIEDIQTAKEEFGAPRVPDGKENYIHRVTVSDGTGVHAGERNRNAKLEQRPL